MDEPEEEVREAGKRFQGPGGTPGGLGAFLFGLGMAIAGGYLLMNHVEVMTGYWRWFGDNTFGLTLVPLIIGIGLLFFNARSIAGWILTGGGLIIIFAGIITSLSVYFRPTSLFNLLVMLTLFAGGVGLMAGALREKK